MHGKKVHDQVGIIPGLFLASGTYFMGYLRIDAHHIGILCCFLRVRL